MKDKCSLCEESNLNVGEKTGYGAVIVYNEKGWFATLSPKTGSNPEKDFSVQLMPVKHLRHISEIAEDNELAKGYGIAFSKISKAVTGIMKEEGRGSENEENAIRVGTYGKSKHPEEHLHFKIFPWTGNIGQPYTVDSTFENSQVFEDENGEKFVKMKPVKKIRIGEKRLGSLANKLIKLLKNSV